MTTYTVNTGKYSILAGRPLLILGFSGLVYGFDNTAYTSPLIYYANQSYSRRIINLLCLYVSVEALRASHSLVIRDGILQGFIRPENFIGLGVSIPGSRGTLVHP